MLTMSGVVNALSFVACLIDEGFWKPSATARVTRSLLRDGMVAFAVEVLPRLQRQWTVFNCSRVVPGCAWGCCDDE